MTVKPRYNPRIHRSGLEEKLGALCKEKGLLVTYEADSLTFITPAQKHRYTPDWKIRDGVYIETKGLFTAADRKKMLLVIEQNPGVQFLIVFQRNNKLSKKSKTTYGDWCTKHAILWCLFSEQDLWMDYIKNHE